MPRSATVPICVLALFLAGCDAFFQPLESTPGVPGSATVTPTLESAVGVPATAAAQAVTQAVTAGAAAVQATAPAESAAPQGGGVLPGDMLSSTEQQEAVDAALDSDQVASVVAAAVDRDTLVTSTAAGATVSDVTALAELGGKPSYRVVYVERMADKGSAARRAEVMIYRYDTAQPLLVGVDLTTGATEELDFASVGQVPLVPSEIAEAAAIARADDSVRQALEAAGLALQSPATGIVAVSADAADRCAMHRCVRVFFSTLRMPAPTFSAVVDMADLEIVQVEPIPTGEGES